MESIDLKRVVETLLLVSTTERAAGSKAYLKSNLDFIGVKNSDIASVVRDESKAHPTLGRAALIQLSLDSFESKFFEIQLFGVKFLEKKKKLLEVEDLRHIELLVRRSSTWALVDVLAKPIASSLVDRDIALAGPVLDDWSTDENFWIRRCSMLALIPSLKKKDSCWPRFVEYADSMIDEREFFIRKAIGWTLREVSKVRPDPIAEFVDRHIAVISGVTFREAVKYLPEPRRGELRDAYKSR